MRCLILFLSIFSIITSHAQLDTFSVYPGDANNDSIVSVRDLLPIGIAWFQETPPREPPMVDWAPQFSEGFDFLTLPNTGINFAHIDTDGNGFIDTLDSDIIALNYDSVVTDPLPPAYYPPLAANPIPDYCPYIRLAFDRDTALVSDTFYLDVFIEGFPGTGVPEEEAVLGTSFTLEFDALNVKDSLLRVYPDTIVGDLMYVYATFLDAVAVRNAPIRKVDFAAAAYGVNSISGNRRLTTLAFITEDLILRSEGEGVGAPFFIDQDALKNSIIIINREEEFFLPDCELLTDTIILFNPATEVKQVIPPKVKHWKLYPNPLTDHLYINGKDKIKRLNVTSINGKWMKSVFLPDLNKEIDLEELPPGGYWVQLIGSNKVEWHFLIKTR